MRFVLLISSILPEGQKQHLKLHKFEGSINNT